MKRARGRPEAGRPDTIHVDGPAVEGEGQRDIELISRYEKSARIYIESLIAERDRLREIVGEIIASGAAHRAAAAEVSNILERILERRYIDAPANAAAVAALKRQGAANRRQAREMRAAGRKVREIMKQMDLSERQVYRLLKKG